MNKKIVIDCLGSDNGEREIALGAIASSYIPLDFILIGDERTISDLLEKERVDKSRFEVIDCSKTLQNGDNPTIIARGGEDISIVKGMLRAKEEDVIGYISAGNTGAVLVGSIFRLGLLNGIKFPALGCRLLNEKRGPTLLLDCGANMDIQPSLLLKFAKIGEAAAKSHYGIISPKIGLLNVGSEEGKGNAFSKEAYKLLKEEVPCFIGNIEGGDLYSGKADVILCDGFAGNVALKSAEAAGLLAERIVRSHASYGEGIEKAADDVHSLFAYTELGASIVYGARKIVLKPHGSATSKTIENCIRIAYEMDRGDVIGELSKTLGE